MSKSFEVETVRKLVTLCLATLVLLVACSRSDSPESVAQDFVERYYVQPNLGKAKALAHGLARHKIEKEQQLLQPMSQAVIPGDRAVSYTLYTTRGMGEDRIFFVYDLAISVDRQTMKKRAFISTSRVKEGWRVTNFQEEDR